MVLFLFLVLVFGFELKGAAAEDWQAKYNRMTPEQWFADYIPSEGDEKNILEGWRIEQERRINEYYTQQFDKLRADETKFEEDRQELFFTPEEIAQMEAHFITWRQKLAACLETARQELRDAFQRYTQDIEQRYH